jgi:LPS-assembly protein
VHKPPRPLQSHLSKSHLLQSGVQQSQRRRLRLLRPCILPLSLAISLAAQAKQPQADAWILCRGPDAVAPFPGEAPTGNANDRDTSAADAQADLIDSHLKDVTTFQGNAEVKRADQWLLADKMTYDHKADRYQAEGSVRYQDSTVRLTASKADAQTAQDVTTLDDIQYQLLDKRGNGRAVQAVVKGQQESYSRATYSSCDPSERKWEIRANSLEIDRDTNIGKAHGATIRIGGVPVLYSPYLSFSLDDSRKSGFLYPDFGINNRNGFEFGLPYYFNIAPNYDATLTPRFYSKRGLMLDGEFRYLTANSKGIIEATYLPNDNITGYDRGAVFAKDFTTFSPHWYASADLNHVSDTHYFEDFSNQPYSHATGLLASQAGVYGRGRYWTAGAYAQIWQVTDDLLPEALAPYRRLPDLYFRWEQPFTNWLDLGVRSEAVQFTHPELGGGSRIDLYPYVALPFEKAAWYVRPELGYRYTAYNLDSGVSPTGNNSPTRGTPIFDLDAGAYFERDTTLFGKSFINTLEPRLYYLWVPYRDQSAIPIFDTQDYTFSYEQLFRTNRFTGADRQGDANQLTGAITTRLLDAEDGREWLTASIGQIHYFTAPRVLLPGETFVDRSSSAYVVDATLAVDDRWSIGGSYQWDPKFSQTDLAAVRAQYRFAGDGVFNVAYRYRPGFVRQTDFSFEYPLNANWRLLGRWNYSFLDRSTLEALAGVEWQDCCMAVRVLARDYIHNVAGQKDLALYFEIELKGLSSFGRETGKLLDRDILGYTR